MNTKFICCDCNMLWLTYHCSCPSCGGLIVDKEIKYMKKNNNYIEEATELLGDSEYGANAFEIIVDLMIVRDGLREKWERCNDTVADYIKKVDKLEEEIKKLKEGSDDLRKM